MAVVAFVVMASAFGLNFAAGQFFAPLGEEEGWSIGSLSAAAAINTAVAGLVQPFAGRLIDRIGARPVIASALGMLAGSYVLLSAVSELWQFFVVYGVLAGVGFGSASSMAVSVLISHWYEQRRATLLARVFMGINVGQLTLLPLGGLLIAQSGPRVAYFVLGSIVAVTALPAAAFLLRSRPADVGQHPDGLADRRTSAAGTSEGTFGQALRSGDWWKLTLAFGLNGATLYLTLLHLPRLADDLGGGAATGGWLIAVAAVCSAVSMLVHGQLAARMDRRWLIVELFGLRAASLGAAAVADGLGLLFVAAALFGAASFPVIPLITGSIGERFGTRAIGAVLGTTFVVHQVGAGLGVLFAGLIRSAAGSYDPALAGAVLLLLLGAVLVSRVGPDPAVARRTAASHTFVITQPSPQGGTS